MKTQKRFCVNGHDTSLRGRDKTGTCKECRSDQNRRKYQHKLGAKSDEALDQKALVDWPTEWGAR